MAALMASSMISSSFVGQRLVNPNRFKVSCRRGGALCAVSREASWCPGTDAPSHLDGSLAGDFGFDPLGLGEDPGKLAWYQQAEIVHARFAMAAAAGILLPELASKVGVSWPGAGVPWYSAGEFSYFATGPSLFIAQIFFMGWAEIRRYIDLETPGAANQDPLFTNNKIPDDSAVGYPGGIFDPFKWSSKNIDSLKLKEIKNGRLAMVSMVGFYAQAYVTGSTPLDNLSAHLADPFNVNVVSNCKDIFIWNWGAGTDTLKAVAPIFKSGYGYPTLS